MLNLKFEIHETDSKNFIEGRAAKIKLKGIYLGDMGELNPSLLHSWHLKMPSSYLEIDL